MHILLFYLSWQFLVTFLLCAFIFLVVSVSEQFHIFSFPVLVLFDCMNSALNNHSAFQTSFFLKVGGI